MRQPSLRCMGLGVSSVDRFAIASHDAMGIDVSRSNALPMETEGDFATLLGIQPCDVGDSDALLATAASASESRHAHRDADTV